MKETIIPIELSMKWHAVTPPAGLGLSGVESRAMKIKTEKKEEKNSNVVIGLSLEDLSKEVQNQKIKGRDG